MCGARRARRGSRAIELFEAVDRSFGFDVRTPRIPGLRYRAYEDIA
ncbi:hypothetical protein WMF18_26150 [Sorangium sp. So ce315]